MVFLAEKNYEGVLAEISKADAFLQDLEDDDKVIDPFYSDRNQAELSRRIEEIEAGNNVAVHELIEAEDE
jgi:hypothetical protein